MSTNSDAYEEGAEAYLNGGATTDCPYETDSLAAMSWRNGWRRAEHEETVGDMR